MAIHVRRREFIATLCGTAAWPLAARAQQPSRVRHIGVFLGLAANADDPGTGEILRMQEAGWVEGKNVRSDYRFGGGDLARINAAAAELVALRSHAQHRPKSAALTQRAHAVRSSS